MEKGKILRTFTVFATIVALFTNLSQFYFLWQEQSQFLFVLATIAIFILITIWLLYISFSTQKKPLPLVNVHAIATVPRFPTFYKPARYILGIWIVLAFANAAAILWQNHEQDEKFIILVTKFDGPENMDSKVTGFIIERLTEEFQKYPNVVILAKDISVSEFEGESKAKSLGLEYHADLVLWGWYDITSSKVWLTGHLTDISSSIVGRFMNPKLSFLLQNEDWLNFQSQPLIAAEMSLAVKYYVGLIYLYSPIEGRENADLVKSYSAAVRAFTDVIEALDPNQKDWLSELHYDRALAKFSVIIFESSGRSDEEINNRLLSDVIPDFSSSILNQPDNYFSLWLRGELYMDLFMRPEAIDDFTRVITLTPEDKTGTLDYLYSMRGGAYASLGECGKAISDFGQLKGTATIDLTHYYKGRCHLRLDQPQEAIDELTLAILREPSVLDAYQLRGEAYVRIKEYSKGLVDFNTVIKSQPDAGRAYIFRGICHAGLGDYKKGIEDEETAIRISTNSEETALAKFLLALLIRDQNK